MVQPQRLLEIIGQYNISAYIHLIGRNSMIDINDYVVHGGAQLNSIKDSIERSKLAIAQTNTLLGQIAAQRRSQPIQTSVSSRPSALSQQSNQPASKPAASTYLNPTPSKPPVAVGGTHIAYINDPVIYMGRPSMGSRILKSIAIATAIVLIILILYHVFASEPLVSKLEQSGWVVYYLRGCKYCTKQRQVFDDHYDNYVEINSHGRQVEGINPPIPCNSALLTGFPLWYNVYSREIKLGVQDKESLNMMVL